MFLLIAHFDVGPDDSGIEPGPAADRPPEGTGTGRPDVGGSDADGPPPSPTGRYPEAVRLLGDQPETRALRWARSTEDPGRWVLVAEFDTAAGFRRAQSPVPVRAALIPWLATARWSAAFEVVATAQAGTWSAPEVIVDQPGR